MKNNDDRFGVSLDFIRKVVTDHAGMIRAGCYIPTRREVAEKDAAWLYNVLIGWWWESPSALIPSDEQVSDVIALLHARADTHSPEIQRIIAEALPPDDP